MSEDSDARLAHGSKILMGDGAEEEQFVEIGSVLDFDTNDSIQLVDVTSHSSGGHAEYIADIKDGDEISFDLNYNDQNAAHNKATGLRGKLGQRVNFRIEAPGDTKGDQFSAIVMSVGRSYPVKSGALVMKVTIKPTGVPAEYVIE